MEKTIYITFVDHQRLSGMVDGTGRRVDSRENNHLRELATELERAEVFFDTDQVPANLITMRSRVKLKNVTTGSELECQLVYPGESNPDQHSVSVLAPLGTALLGRTVGEQFDVQLPKGATTFEVLELCYQPEAAGDSHL